MMLQIRQRVRHLALAGADGSRPKRPPGALDGHLSRHRIKLRADHQLRSDGTGSQLRRRQVQVVAPLEFVVGKLVALSEADAPRRALRIDHVHSGDLRLFAAVLRKLGNIQRLVMRTQACPVSFVEPLRSHPGLTTGRLPALDAPLIHAHAVGEVFGFTVHGLAIPGARHMGKSRTAHQASRRLGRKVGRGQQLPR